MCEAHVGRLVVLIACALVLLVASIVVRCLIPDRMRLHRILRTTAQWLERIEAMVVDLAPGWNGGEMYAAPATAADRARDTERRGAATQVTAPDMVELFDAVKTVDQLITVADEQVDVQKRSLGAVLCSDFNVVRRQVAICRRLSANFAALPLAVRSAKNNAAANSRMAEWQRLASTAGNRPEPAWIKSNVTRVQASHQHAAVVETHDETQARREAQRQQEEEDAKLAAQLAQG